MRIHIYVYVSNARMQRGRQAGRQSVCYFSKTRLIPPFEGPKILACGDPRRYPGHSRTLCAPQTAAPKFRIQALAREERLIPTLSSNHWH